MLHVIYVVAAQHGQDANLTAVKVFVPMSSTYNCIGHKASNTECNEV